MTPVLPGPKQKQPQMGGQSLPKFPFTATLTLCCRRGSSPAVALGHGMCSQHQRFFLESVQCAWEDELLEPS